VHRSRLGRGLKTELGVLADRMLSSRVA